MWEHKTYYISNQDPRVREIKTILIDETKRTKQLSRNAISLALFAAHLVPFEAGGVTATTIGVAIVPECQSTTTCRRQPANISTCNLLHNLHLFPPTT